MTNEEAIKVCERFNKNSESFGCDRFKSKGTINIAIDIVLKENAELKENQDKIKINFLTVPDGILRKDLIKEIKKYERDRYEGGTYYGIQIIAEKEYNYEYLDKGGIWSNKKENSPEEKRDEIYEEILREIGV